MSKKTDSLGVEESLIFVPERALCPVALPDYNHENFLMTASGTTGIQRATALASIMPELIIFKKKAPEKLVKNDFVLYSGIFGTTSDGADTNEVIIRVSGWSGLFGLPYEMLLGYEPETYKRASKK